MNPKKQKTDSGLENFFGFSAPILKLATFLFAIFIFSRVAVASAAIAVDAVSNSGGKSSVSSFSWSHPVSGDERFLLVSVFLGERATSSRIVNSVTYGGSSLSNIRTDERPANGLQSSLWSLINPRTGLNNISVSLNGVNAVAAGLATSLNGVDELNPIDAQTGQNTGLQDSVRTNITTVTDNDLIFDSVLMHGPQNLTVGAGQILRQIILNTSIGDIALSSLGPKTPPGTAAMAWQDGGLSGSPLWLHSVVAIKPSNPPPSSDTTPPAVSITYPPSTSTISGTINISASAADNVGVVGVQFKLDGSNLGAEDTLPPYSFLWNTGTASNGLHILTAVARDIAGNQTISSPISVNVRNIIQTGPPLIDMRPDQTYFGFSGGLYENSTNTAPLDHSSAGINIAGNIVPRDTSGNPNPAGKIVLMSIGMSNGTQEWCRKLEGASSTWNGANCNSWSFTGQARADSRVNNSNLVIANGALGSQVTNTWDQAFGADPDVQTNLFRFTNNYDRVRDYVLAPQGLTEAQVQAVWVKLANMGPKSSLPASSADAYVLEERLGNALRAMKLRYPNLQQVFLMSRIYGGYATITLNPEPYAYESGFSVKWLIQAQIDEMRNGGTIVDTRAGDLNYQNGAAPWITWSPYLWANGLTPRSDGLTWSTSDFESDGTHPSDRAEQRIGQRLLYFFLTSPYTPWFRSGTLAGSGALSTRNSNGLLAELQSLVSEFISKFVSNYN